jgi:MFS transporter, OFA family, oxalate/formate antiporter
MVCGFSETRATLLYSLASIVGGIGSYLWGVLDQKIGIKKATMWMCVAHSVAGLTFALASMQIGGKVMAVISAFIVGTILGVSSNYVGSFTAQVFGRYGYASAFSLVIMIVTGLRSLGYSLVGVINTATNSNMIAYMIAAVLGVVALLMTIRVDDSCIDPVANRMNEMKEAECM